MNLNLTAKTAVVTGASRGIGLATAQTLIDEGVRVVAAPAQQLFRRLPHANGYSVDRHSYWRYVRREVLALRQLLAAGRG